MSEAMLVRNCSPTLAGMKTGSLFSCPSSQDLPAAVRRLNRRLRDKGIRVLSVPVSEKRALIYVYRPGSLCADLSCASCRSLLDALGYSGCTSEQCVAKLVRKLRTQKAFPHEIGLFLGYPPEDVRGFIENRADCAKCVGCWKVYGDADRAQALFQKYRKCTRIYCEQLAEGRPLERLTVATA